MRGFSDRWQRILQWLRGRTQQIVVVPEPEIKKVWVACVRIGEDDFLIGPRTSMHARALTEVGKAQVREAANAIRIMAGGQPVTVLINQDEAVCYRQTAEIIRDEIPRASRAFTHLWHVPGLYDTQALEQFEGLVVVVTSGTSLEATLLEAGRIDVPMGVRGPANGSVFQMVITYHYDQSGFLQQDGIRFI